MPSLRQRILVLSTVSQILLAGWTSTLAIAVPCPGDCNGDHSVTIEELVRGVSIALGAQEISACPSFDLNHDELIAINELVTAVGAASSGCPKDQHAFILTSDFESGGYATLDLDDPGLSESGSLRGVVHSDAVVRHHGNTVFVLNRLFGDNVLALDPGRGLSKRFQCSTGTRSNPHDIRVVAPGKAYVSRFQNDSILIVSVDAAADCHDFVLGEISLATLADADGIPEMDQIAVHGERAYVSLQRLDRRNFFEPAMTAALAVIDINDDRLLGEIRLTGTNPFASTKGLILAGDELVIAEAGRLRVFDGGLERVDLQKGIARGFFFTEQAAGGDILDFVLAEPTLGYAIVSHHDYSTSLIAFDPVRGVVTDTLVSHVSYLADLELNDRGEMYVADRTFRAPGVRIFDSTTGAEKTGAPIDVGLPPFEILFVR